MNTNSGSRRHPPTPDAISLERVRLLGPGELRFRFDTHMRLVWDQIHGNGSFDRAIDAIDAILGDAVELGIAPVAVAPYTVLNAIHLDATIADLSGRGIRRVEIARLDPAPPLTSFHDPLTHMSAEWNDWVLERIRHAARTHDVAVTILFESERTMEV